MAEGSTEGFSELTAAFVEPDERPDVHGDPSGNGSGAAPQTVTEPVAEAEADGRRRWPWRHMAAAFVAGLAVAAAVSVPFVMRASSADAGRGAVEAVARRFVRNLTTFDYRTLDADIAAIQRDATGNFRGELETALGGDITVFRDTIVQAEAHSSGTIHAVVVRSVSGDTARAVAFVDQSIRNKDNPEPRTVLRRVELTLVETTSGWRVDKVRAPGVGPA